MGHHSNKEIKKHIESSSKLVEKMNELTSKLQKALLQGFKDNFGVPLPNAIEADVRVVQSDMVYSTDPIFDEYKDGAQGVLDAALEEDWPTVALNSLTLVSSVLKAITGSGTVQTGITGDSVKTTAKDPNNPLDEKTFVTACMAIVEEASSKDWATESNFYVSYYVMVVWSPAAEQLPSITTTR